MSSDEALRITLVCMLPLLSYHGKTVAASSSPTPIHKGWTSAPRHQGVTGRIATVEPTEPTVKIGAPIPLDQADGQSRQHADWALSRYERNLCFFLKAVQCRNSKENQENRMNGD